MLTRVMRFLAIVLMLMLASLTLRAPARAAGSVTPIKYGDTVEGEITKDATQIAYKFTGKQDDVVVVLIRPIASSDLVVAARVLDSDGTSLADTEAARDIEYIPVPGAQIVARLPSDGSYTLIASHAKSDTNLGKYSLTLLQAPLLVPGKPVSGTVKASKDDAFYGFYAIEGTALIGITYERKSGDYGPEISIQDIESESGVFIPVAHLSGDQLAFGSLTIKGGDKLYMVTLEGSDYDERTATYELTLLSTK